MQKVSKFRVVRLRCQIQLGEVAKLANISHQRLSQIELRNQCSYPQNPERLIKALEAVIVRKKQELEKAESICKQERESLFQYVKEGDYF